MKINQLIYPIVVALIIVFGVSDRAQSHNIIYDMTGQLQVGEIFPEKSAAEIPFHYTEHAGNIILAEDDVTSRMRYGPYYGYKDRRGYGYGYSNRGRGSRYYDYQHGYKGTYGRGYDGYYNSYYDRYYDRNPYSRQPYYSRGYGDRYSERYRKRKYRRYRYRGY